jgi:hypothetical protein
MATNGQILLSAISRPADGRRQDLLYECCEQRLPKGNRSLSPSTGFHQATAQC